MFRLLAPLTMAVALPAAAQAQDALPDNLAERMAGARTAEAAAQTMASVLEANAVAQRQFIGMANREVDADLGGGYRGAVAVPGDTLGVWQAVIVGQPGGEDAPLVALAEYEIAAGEILSETIHPAGDAPALDGDLLAMARAQIVAPRAVIAAPQGGFCYDGEEVEPGIRRSFTFLTFALPPDADGAFDTYVLNGPFDGTSVPLGKHYRVHFDEFGVIGEPERLTDNCELVSWDAADPELAMRVYVTEQPSGDWPSAINTFLSAQLPMSMGVVTGELIWPMAGGMIAPPVPAAEAGY